MLLDVNLLGPESIRTIHRLARAYPGLQVLALAACDREYRSRVPEMLAQTPLVNVSANGDGLATLTPRELEILSLIGTGATNSEIAEALCISKRTVETHVSNIYGKLRFAGRPQAVRYAVEHGLVDNQS
ncbi:MAG: DNA-binding response regulator [Chloroflexi bacterium]|nr:MAG: DNA-binding response regulator [Chloroflexota bacterium]